MQVYVRQITKFLSFITKTAIFHPYILSWHFFERIYEENSGTSCTTALFSTFDRSTCFRSFSYEGDKMVFTPDGR